MAEQSKIEWTDATWNPITGCTLVSEGCRHCYAATLAATRLKNHPSRKGLARINAAGEAKFTGEVRLNEQWLDQPLRWKRPRMIFVCAHGDLFHESVPDEWIDRVFAVMALASQHTFQVLTKRPERARDYLMGFNCDGARRFNVARKAGDIGADEAYAKASNRPWPLPNVWLGTSIEDQATADARIPHLLATPAAIRFVSAEPLLGPVDLGKANGLPVYWEGDASEGPIPVSSWGRPIGQRDRRGWVKHSGNMQPWLDWIIVGGESGPKARPMHPEWARSLRDQCKAAGVAFFFKQWGEWEADQIGPEDARSGQHPPGHVIFRKVGKSAAGRLLGGREWNEVPTTRTGKA